MRILTSKHLKLKFGKKYLEIAAMLPQFGGGFIRTLQDMKAHHNELAEEAHKRSRPPANVELDFLYFQLIEMFHLEDFDKLRDGLYRLLPALKDDSFYRFSTDAFSKQAESIQGGGSGFLGYILREKGKRLLGMDPYMVMPKLPESVDFIKVEYIKALPSVFLVTLDVNLTETATRHLVRLQDRRYEPAPYFRSVLPWRAMRGGWSESASESEMRMAILHWLQDLRAGVENVLRPYLSGYFTRQSAKTLTRLPAVEVYALKGGPEDLDTFHEWTNKERAWLDSLGFRFIFDAYGNDRVILTVPERDDPELHIAYRLIALWQSYIKSISTSGFGGDERRAISHDTTYLLRALSVVIVLHEFLNIVQSNISKLRKVTFGAMKRGKLLSRYMKLNNTIQKESVLLDRISMEFEQQKGLVSHDALEIGELKSVIPSLRAPEDHFAINALVGLEKRMQNLTKQVEHVKRSFSDFLALQNMRAIYFLQRIVLIISIVAMTSALLNALGNWPNIKRFLNEVFRLGF